MFIEKKKKEAVQLTMEISKNVEQNFHKTQREKYHSSLRPYHFKFFKGCFPQTLLGSFLNILLHIKL